MIKHRLHRLKTQITQIAIIVTSYWLLVTATYAQSLSSTELINNAKNYDSKQIVYEGEIIGDIMKRQDSVWLNINDSENAIGVYCNIGLIDGLELFVGGYNRRGDWVKISGIFNRACKIHGGDLDIHADKIEIIKKGKILNEAINLQKQKLVYKLIGVLLCLLILRLFLARQRRRSAPLTT